MAKRVPRSKLAKKWHSDFIKVTGIDHAKIASYSIYQNRSRVNSTQGPRPNAIPLSESTWTEQVWVDKLRKIWLGYDKVRHQVKFRWEGGFVAKPKPIPPTLGKRMPLPDWLANWNKNEEYTEPTPREVVERKIAEEKNRRFSLMQSDRIQRIEEYRCLVIAKHGDYTTKVFINGELYFFEEERGKLRLRSVLYRGGDWKVRFYNEKIYWKVIK